MSRWAEAFRASLARHDTADSADSSSPAPPATPESVSNPSSPSEKDGEVSTPCPETVSAVSSVSRAAKVVNAGASGREQAAATERAISAAYISASLQRPPSWSDPVAVPSRGCFCSCCKGQRWWCEREAPKGWRCSTCHPPSHLTPDAVTKVRT